MTTATIRVGTASWTDHDPFYPAEYNKVSMKSQRISYYARYFDMVEVDSTFYHLQPTHNFALWAERTPEDFVFDVKAYGELTWHHRDEQKQPIVPSADTFAAFQQMIQPMRAAGKMGAVLFQFPPWFKPTEENIEYFDTIRELLPDDTIAIEFRQRAWLEGQQLDETRALLTDHEFAFVAVDEPQIGTGSVPPVMMVTNPAFAMVRFHGRNAKMWYGRNLESSRQRFDYLYSADELLPWAERVAAVAAQMGGGQVHVVTNNNASNYGIVNALQLQLMFGQPVGKGNPLPEAVDSTLVGQSVAQAEEQTPRAGQPPEPGAEQPKMPGM
ncbi:MAG: DUF72 domain-containing protein [Ktedonobacterales bacterium]